MSESQWERTIANFLRKLHWKSIPLEVSRNPYRTIRFTIGNIDYRIEMPGMKNNRTKKVYIRLYKTVHKDGQSIESYLTISSRKKLLKETGLLEDKETCSDCYDIILML